MKTEKMELTEQLCKALSIPRLRIIKAIACGAETFNDLMENTGYSRTNLNNHIKILECAGLVVPDRNERRPVSMNTRSLKLTGKKFIFDLL